MKTKNNVQKTALRSVAVVLSFVLLSFTVTAQGYWKQLLTNNSFSEIASALVDHHSTPSELNHKPESVSITHIEALVETTKEAPLNVEVWMEGNETFWVGSDLDGTISEPGLEIENWMVNADFFTFDITPEQPLQVEAWMVEEDFWN
jgi:hypothetical protein